MRVQTDPIEELLAVPESRPRPAPERAAKPNSAKPSSLERRRARRAAKKKRIKAMSRKRRVARRAGILSTWLLGLLATLMIAVIVLFYSLSDVPPPSSLPLPQVATILYADGSVLATVGTVNRTLITIDQVPAQVKWDVLAAEDRDFYDEPGVSITGTLRAAANDVTGGDTEGGSGITQQYVKNAYLSNARTLSRKLKELAIAVKLSRDYPKDTILEYYLNSVYFGRGAYGIQAAAQAYFGEDVGRLDTAQGAVLAALLRAPSYYDPAVNPAAAKGRWAYVLSGMVATGHLTRAQANTTRYPTVLPQKKNAGLTVSGPKALIAQQVIDDLETHGMSEEEIYARGLTIQTTIEPKAQAAAEHAIDSTFANLTKAQRGIKNALIAVAPKTGAVLAYYGGPSGTDYAGREDYYDYAGLGFAAPGSSFKPYTLATALTQTLTSKSTGTPVTIGSIVDGSYCAQIQGTQICNDPSDRPLSSSRVSVANAMKYSLNTTFDQMAATVGPGNVATTARAAGISKTINGKPSLTGANGATTFGIGIGDYPVHPMDQAVGFATFADGGIANPAYFVTKATASDGEVLYTHRASPTRAIDAKVANDVTMTLEPIAGYSGDGLDDRESAAKTGTEGIQYGKARGGNSDAWMVGFTPQVSTAVWVGSGNSTTPIVNANGLPEYGRDLPGRTWQLFMDTWLAGQPRLALPSRQEVYPPGTKPSSGGTSSATSSAAASSTAASTIASAPTSSSAAVAPSATSIAPAPSVPSTSARPAPSASARTSRRPRPTPPPPPTSPKPTPTCSAGLSLPNCSAPPRSTSASATSSSSPGAAASP